MSKQANERRYNFESGTEPVVIQAKQVPRIGIYSGSFDPVHAGHLVFALKSQKAAGLQEIYFVPERRPLLQNEPEHYVHRSVMLGRALQPYKQFSIFEVPHARLNLRNLQQLIAVRPQAEYCLLTTAGDLLWHDGELPAIYRKLQLVIAVTSHAQMAEVLHRLAKDNKPFSSLTFVDIGSSHISSATIRAGIRKGQQVRGVLPSVWRYARKQWLYLPPIHR